MDKVYKIRLKGTPLFYQPTKGRWSNERSNLSERGKIYESKPKVEKYTGELNISEARYKKYGLGQLRSESYRKGQFTLSVTEDQLEVVTFNVVEVNPPE